MLEWGVTQDRNGSGLIPNGKYRLMGLEIRGGHSEWFAQTDGSTLAWWNLFFQVVYTNRMGCGVYVGEALI